MPKTILKVLLIISPFIKGFAQTQFAAPYIKRNIVYMEILGNGFYYSLNYERIFSDKNNIKLGGRIGITHMNFGSSSNKNIGTGIPMEFVHIGGKGKHHFELGFGITPLYYRDIRGYYGESDYMTFTSFYRIGYRFCDFSKEGKNGAFFKIGLLPLLGTGFKVDDKSSIDIFKEDKFFYLTSIGLAYGVIF